MYKLLPVSAAMLLTACATLSADAAPDGMHYARLGQSVYVDGPRVTPIRVLEDSRCPMEARCVWAGDVRILARIGAGRAAVTRELTLGKAVSVADGVFELASVMPPRSIRRTIRPRDYRFGFRFAGGL